MKRFITLMLAFALVMGAVANSSAAEIKAKGQMDFAFQWADNTNFKDSDQDGDSEDDFSAMQRVRTQIDIVASENLSGVLFFEIGTQNWGNAAQGADLGTDGVNIETRRAYIDFKVPTTELNVRMGLRGLALPAAALGTPVLDDDVAGIVLSHPIADMGSVTAFWARLNNNSNGETGTVGGVSPSTNDEFDVFGATVALDFDTIKVTPWAAYAAIGKDSLNSDGENYINGSAGAAADDATVQWYGVAFEADVIENLFIDLDVMYSNMDSDTETDEASGWFMATKIGYKMDMFTPVLMGWYSTGDDDDSSDGSEKFTSVSATGLSASSFGTDNGYFDTADSLITDSGVGTWGIGLALEDISFVEDLSHVVRVVYYRGTNDETVANYDGDTFKNLTEEDSAWEVNLNTKYQIYENLSAAVELGWITVDLDNDDDTEDAWKAAVGFQYKF